MSRHVIQFFDGGHPIFNCMALCLIDFGFTRAWRLLEWFNGAWIMEGTEYEFHDPKILYWATLPNKESFDEQQYSHSSR